MYLYLHLYLYLFLKRPQVPYGHFVVQIVSVCLVRKNSLKGILWKICDDGSKVFLLGDMKCGKGLTVKNGLVPVETSVSRLFSAASCQYCTKTFDHHLFPSWPKDPFKQSTEVTFHLFSINLMAGEKRKDSKDVPSSSVYFHHRWIHGLL